MEQQAFLGGGVLQGLQGAMTAANIRHGLVGCALAMVDGVIRGIGGLAAVLAAFARTFKFARTFSIEPARALITAARPHPATAPSTEAAAAA